MNLDFNNTYTNLPEIFYERTKPSSVPKPSFIKVNSKLAEELRINKDFLNSQEALEIFVGNKIANGSDPIAQAYAGHQFGHFAGQLGDGRAILLGEVVDINGKHRDIQLKGCGQTKFSRRGDGKAGIGPVVREYIISEAVHALKVPTTRSLAAVSTGEFVYREEKKPGAVLTRVASSHVRVGTFEFFAWQEDKDSLKTLSDYVIDRHYPKARDAERPYLEMLKLVASNQAKLIAKWMSIGFIHGVMNTDNMAISGETIDYGPCAFMNFYDPNKTFSSIDHYGRYAYQSQGPIANWNLSVLAGTLIPLIDDDRELAIKLAKEILGQFMQDFNQTLQTTLLEKIGIKNQSENDFALVQELLNLMHKQRADFTLSFRYLSRDDKTDFLKLFDQEKEALDWLNNWQQRLKNENASIEEIYNLMNSVNPAIIPRNHKVEEAIQDAETNFDYEKLNSLCEILEKPFSEEHLSKMLPPDEKEETYVTFCGT